MMEFTDREKYLIFEAVVEYKYKLREKEDPDAAEVGNLQNRIADLWRSEIHEESRKELKKMAE